MEIRNSRALKKHNQFTILNQIIENQPISRAELTKKLNVSHATVSYLVKDLIKQGLVVETEYSESTGGRPPVLLEFKGNNKYIVSIELEETTISYGVFNLNLDLIYNDAFSVDGKDVIDLIYSRIQETLSEHQLSLNSVIGIGISIHGIYKVDQDLIIDSTTKFWEGINIKNELVKRFKLPVYIENDANLAVYYEWCYGIGQNYSNLIYIHLGDGIGSGIIINNSLYRGSHGNAGELGHIKVKASGPRCDCGGVGCLEAISSIEAIKSEILKRLERGEKSLLTGIASPPYTITRIMKAYNNHDYLVRSVIDEAIRYLVSALSSLVNIFDPDLIILGGLFSDFEQEVIENIKKELKETCYANLVDELRIYQSSRKECLQLIAAAAYVFDKWKQKI
jgi:predicted NBD/HSP70 family sugar kinase